MPPWGRPSGAWPGKRRKEWERQTRQWEEQRRFEELESDSDDGQGVGLNDSFISDDLNFTGADLSPYLKDRRHYEYSDNSDDSYDRVELDDRTGAAMQVALRDKEEWLVQMALERIRRAQLMGKTAVKLSQDEIDALERKRQMDEAKAKKPATRPKASDKRQSSGRSSSSLKTVLPIAGRRKSRSSLTRHTEDDKASYPPNLPPGFVVAGPDGKTIYAPIGYEPATGPSSGSSSRPGSRSTSSHSLSQQTPPLSQPQYRSQQKRYFSVPEQHLPSSTSRTRTPPSPRPQQADTSWTSRSRSASSSQPYPLDPLQYQTHSPPLPQIPAQHFKNRRNVSGPSEFHYPYVRSPPPSSSARPYASSSDPSLLRREYSAGSGHHEIISTEYDDDEDDDEDEGVQVDVRPYGQGYNVNVTSGGSGSGSLKPRKGRR